MKKQKHIPFEHEIILGNNIRLIREHVGVHPREISRKLKITEKAYLAYEAGALVPLPHLEIIGKMIDHPVQKKYIRRISFLRKLEREKNEEQVELNDIYHEILPNPIEEY